MLFYIERELFQLQLSKFSVSKLKPPSTLWTNYKNTAFGVLEPGTRVNDVPHSLGCNHLNESFIICKHNLDNLAVKMTNLRQGALTTDNDATGS